MKFVKIAVFLALTSCCNNSYAKDFYSWVQIKDNEHLSIRSVSKDKVCPKLIVDEEEKTMSIRANPGDRFENTVCEFEAPINAGNIVLNGVRMPTLKAKDIIKKIGLIGDTGCRQNAIQKQNCSKDWHYKQIISSLISKKPDFIVHIGDYLYREGTCLNNLCPNNPGDKDFVWEADFLDPTSEAMKKFVFLFVRGNHENCKRSHIGWFRYLDSEPYEKECKSYLGMQSLKIADKNLYFIDTSNGGGNLSDNLKDSITQDLSTVRDGEKNWLFSHIPIVHSSGNDVVQLPLGIYFLDTKLSDKFSAVFSGHMHAYELIKIAYPVGSEYKKLMQVICGNSGTSLDNKNARIIDVVSKRLAKDLKVLYQEYESIYGYAIIDTENSSIELMSRDGISISKHGLL